jgi:acetoin utilization deacetylase AcuC-like enzyme
MTLFYSHTDFDGHITPSGHPEQVDRLTVIHAALADLALDRRAAPLASHSDLLRCHPARYVARVQGAVPTAGWAQLDGDTYLAPGSMTAALRAVGGACAAVDAVLAPVDQGARPKTAFVACRPPGHHAEFDTAMGFCLFGTVAIAAKRALDHHGLSRVAIVDFDVHHGNGTQNLMWDEKRCLFASTHQMPLYPGSGRSAERGAHGQILNVPLQERSGSAGMRAAYTDVILPALAAWRPELILLSAGFDAHRADPLGGLDWQTEDYAWLTHQICALAADCSAGRVVSCLEGGYDLTALAACARAHVNVLKEHG